MITLEQHVTEICNETAKRVLTHTPQLYVFKDEKSKTIQSHGCSVLVRLRSTYYMITARHCVVQNDKLIKIGVLNSKGHLRLIGGHVTMNTGEDDRVDLAVIKLLPASVEILSESYKFLDFEKVRPTANIGDKTDYLIAGYPISQTSVDNVRRKIRHTPFVYIGKSKENHTYSKLGYKRELNTLVHFDKRRGKYIGTDEMIMNPEPTGISGSGLWYIQSYEIADPSQADFYLVGILIEHDSRNRLMVATKSEEIWKLFQSSVNNFGNG
jgi:hypothetical protein